MANKKDVAAFIGITERQLENIIKKYPGAPVAHGRGQWDTQAMVQWYIGILKAQNKKPKENEDFVDDEEFEKEFAKKEKALKLRKLEVDIKAKEIKNDKDEFLNSPNTLLEYALSTVAGALSSRFDGLIPRMKLACPDLTPKMMMQLEEEKLLFQNECANVSIDFSEYEEGYHEDDTEGA